MAAENGHLTIWTRWKEEPCSQVNNGGGVWALAECGAINSNTKVLFWRKWQSSQNRRWRIYFTFPLYFIYFYIQYAANVQEHVADECFRRLAESISWIALLQYKVWYRHQSRVRRSDCLFGWQLND